LAADIAVEDTAAEDPNSRTLIYCDWFSHMIREE